MKLEWMYSQGHTSNAASFIDEEKEAFLLGKKRVDIIIDEKDLPTDQAALAGSKASIYGISANTDRDIQAKVRDDPLLAFKRQEQASLQAVMSNPLRMRQIQKKDGVKKSKKEKKEKKSKRSESGEMKRSDSREMTKSNRVQSRSPSPPRRSQLSKSPEVTRNQRSHRPRSPRRQRSRTPPRHRSRSPAPRHTTEKSSRHRSRSPRNHSSSSHPSKHNNISPATLQKERDEKIEKMKLNASSWNSERSTRIESDKKKDIVESEKDLGERKRRHESLMGSSSSFMADMNRVKLENI